jgi:hypothetical protein
VTQAAALLRATAHAAAAAVPWLLRRARHNYTIMISTRAPIVRKKITQHDLSDPARVRSTHFSFCFATTLDRKEVLLASQQMGHLLQARFHNATLPASATHGAPHASGGRVGASLSQQPFFTWKGSARLDTSAATPVVETPLCRSAEFSRLLAMEWRADALGRRRPPSQRKFKVLRYMRCWQ